MRLKVLYLLLAVSLCASRVASADMLDTTRPSDVALEVESLRDLQVTPPQIAAIRGDAIDSQVDTETADLDAINTAAASNRICLVTLERLRESLLTGDASKIEQSEKDLSALEDKLNVNLSPRTKPGVAADRAAFALLPRLSATQIAAYLAQRSEDVSDPTEILLSALIQCQGMTNEDSPARRPGFAAGLARPGADHDQGGIFAGDAPLDAIGDRPVTCQSAIGEGDRGPVGGGNRGWHFQSSSPHPHPLPAYHSTWLVAGRARGQDGRSPQMSAMVLTATNLAGFSTIAASYLRYPA